MISTPKKLLTALAFATLSVSAHAGPNPFADCGIGAALFGDTHWAAVSSNVIWDSGSTAVTSATASPDTCSAKKNKAALFIRDSYEQIVEESAKGEKKHLVAALNLFECQTDQNVAALKVRNSLGHAVSNNDYAAKQHLDKSADLFNAIDSACKI